MVVTPDTSQADMSVLNDCLLSNKYSMSVMAETSHVPMAGEHAPTAEAAMQFAMAVSRAGRVVYTGTADAVLTISAMMNMHAVR